VKNKFKQIKSFTISEMIVVLLITTIVMGMAFSILNLVQKQMAGIEYNYERGTKVNLLRQALWIDFNTYSTIYYHTTTNSLLCENEISGIKYNIEDDWILRENDTIPIKLINKAFYFDGKKIEAGLIDAIELTIGEKGIEKKIFVYKKNTASTYIN